MAKKSINFILSFLFFGLSLSFFSCSKKADEARLKEVVVYSYDSFAGEWGAAGQIAELFTQKTGYTLNVVNCGQASTVLSRAIEEKDDAQADVIIGIDNMLAPSALNEKILDSYKPKGLEQIDERLLKELGGGNYLIPYDWSHFAVIYDKASELPRPSSLEDLTLPLYKNKIVLIDPRTSSVGLGFLAWTEAVYKEKTTDYWSRLSENILSMTPGWSASWGMFKKGEAPLVISYTTSPASIVEYDGEDYAEALIFEDGHAEQVEGFAILKNAPNKKGAQAFADFFISKEAQALLPLTQWMNPANRETELPESYKKAAPVPQKTVITSAENTQKILDEVVAALEK